MAKLTEEQKQAKLHLLAEIMGYDDAQGLLEVAVFDSIVPCICTEPDCDATYDWEPDCRDELCEECGNESVDSCLILAGVV